MKAFLQTQSPKHLTKKELEKVVKDDRFRLNIKRLLKSQFPGSEDVIQQAMDFATLDCLRSTISSQQDAAEYILAQTIRSLKETEIYSYRDEKAVWENIRQDSKRSEIFIDCRDIQLPPNIPKNEQPSPRLTPRTAFLSDLQSTKSTK